MSIKMVHAVALALVFACLSCAASAQQNQPVKIGTIVSLAGPLALSGQAVLNGYKLAQKVVNARGGINGRPIELLVEDDASNADTAVTKINGFLGNSQIKALLGPLPLASTLAVGGITSRTSFPQISISGLGLPLERDRKCIFHMFPPQRVNAESLVAYAVDEAKAKRVAVLYDSGFGQAVMNELKDVAPKYGLEFVATEKYDIAATDMSSQVAKIKASNPDLTFLVSGSPVPFRNARQLQVQTPIVTTIAAAVPEIVKAMGPGSEGVTFADYLVSEEPRAREKEFVDLFKAEFGKAPKNFEAAGYDSVMVLVKALSEVGVDAANDKICGAIKGKYSGVSHNYDFSSVDLGGITVSDFVYSRVIDGAFKRIPFVAQNRNQ